MARRVAKASAAGKVKAVRYLRVSRMQDRYLHSDTFHSADLQIEAIDSELNQRFGPEGWELLDVMGNHGQGTFADFDVSGTSMERAGLEHAIDEAIKGGATAIGVLNLSRWGRTVGPALRKINELAQSGINVISAHERIDVVSPEGNFMLTTWLNIAQLYADQKGAEWRRLIEHRAELGEHHGQPPAGYVRASLPPDARVGGRRQQHTAGPITPDPVTAPHILAAFESYALGDSKMAVGRALVKAGVISTPGQAAGVLRNRAYRQAHNTECNPRCSKVKAHGTLGEVRSWELDAITGKRLKTNEGNWYSGRHEGIVSAVLFDRVGERLRRTPDSPRREVTDIRHPLQGLVRCGYCGRALALDTPRPGYYVMRDHSGKGIGCQGPGVVSPNPLLAVVKEHVEAVLHLIGEAKLQASLKADRTAAPATAPSPEKRERIVQTLAKVENAIDIGELEADVGAARKADLRKKLQQMDEELAAVRRRPSVDTNELTLALRRGLEEWPTADAEHQRKVISQVISSVYIWRRSDDAPFRQPYGDRIIVEPIAALRPDDWKDPVENRRRSL